MTGFAVQLCFVLFLRADCLCRKWIGKKAKVDIATGKKTTTLRVWISKEGTLDLLSVEVYKNRIAQAIVSISDTFTLVY